MSLVLTCEGELFSCQAAYLYFVHTEYNEILNENNFKKLLLNVIIRQRYSIVIINKKIK